mmetsp:Transcript_111989/g.311820  ORF Transcript_111989/g.311820 Transcript_111989/m.311820 type:complete len:273 (-) Transcript_111989:19-837(-)
MLNSFVVLAAATSMQVKIWPASSPPPMASNAMVAPVAMSASVMSSMKLGKEALMTCFAPMRFKRSTISCSVTTLTSGIPSFMQIRFSICPRFDAAAVSTNALWPSRRMVSTIPSAASGLMNHAAACAGVTPSGNGWHCAVRRVLYSAYISPPMTPTTFPKSAWAWSELPAFTTTPAPSFPADSGRSRRPPCELMTLGGTAAASAGPVGPPAACRRVPTSADASSSSMSEGLRGVASMRTTTSLGFGSGIGTEASDISTTPSSALPLLTVLRS